MKDERLWLRLGDASEYEEFGQDISALAEQLAAAGIRLPIRRCSGGITAEYYEGQNYISLYWGDEEGNLLHNINKDELEAIERFLENEEDEE